MKKDKGIVEKIINIVLDILIFLFGIVLLILIYKNIQVKILGNDYSSFFGYSVFEVQTGSMAKTINIGDWIIVKNTDDYEVGDIITFKKDKDFITHRIVESYKGTYITKGDANNTKDEPITEEQIVGTVTKILPHFGIFKKTLFNPFVLVALIATLVVVNYVYKKNKDDKTIKPLFKKEKKEKVIKEEKKKEEVTVKEEKKIKGAKIVQDKDYKETKDKNVEFTQVNEDKEPVVTKEEIADASSAEVSEEDLDKTMYFRAIKVDRDELEGTFMEIEENQKMIEEAEAKEAEKIALKKQKEAEARERKERANAEVDTSIVNNELEMLKKTVKRKFTNIIDKSMYIKEQELIKIVGVLNNSEELENNEASIRNEFIKNYIDVKYYNHCGDYNVEYTAKNMTSRIVDSIKDMSEQMISSYKGTDSKYADKVMKFTNIFILVMYLDQADGDIGDLDPIKEMFRKKITKYFKDQNITDKQITDMIDQIIEIQRLHKAMIRRSTKKLENDTFELVYNQLTTKKNFYGLDLNYNINFSKVYSDYILDKTYQEGTVAEDKIPIMLSLVSIQLTEDMITGNFKKKYLLYVPGSLYEKESKLAGLTKISENEYLKNNIYILVKYADLIKNKKVIKDIRKQGYRFALVFDTDVEIKDSDISIIDVVDYVFIDKKNVTVSKITSKIPKDLSKNIINENVLDKAGVYSSGGEK